MRITGTVYTIQHVPYIIFLNQNNSFYL